MLCSFTDVVLGLPLAVTLALAFATKRMTQENLLVRVLGSCETMANASVVCTDKTGTLTQNDMTVVAGSLGIHCKFVRQLEYNGARTNAGEAPSPDIKPEMITRKHPDDFSVDQEKLKEDGALSEFVKILLQESIAINSTAFEDINPETGMAELVGSKTETALLKFAQDFKWDWKSIRSEANKVLEIPFSSERKAMGVVVKRKGPGGGYRLYLKGASEILTKLCTSHVVVPDTSKAPTDTDEAPKDIEDIDVVARDNISRAIIFYANQMLRTIALCYRDFEVWPPKGVSYTPDGDVSSLVLHFAHGDTDLPLGVV